jgi:hypothetical protein
MTHDWTKNVGPGWKHIVQKLVDLSNEEGAQIGQVKEKFGGLRFYLDSYPSEKLNKAIEVAEKLSFRTCEFCGWPGKLRDGGWMKTRCDDCQEEHKRTGAYD